MSLHFNRKDSGSMGGGGDEVRGGGCIYIKVRSNSCTRLTCHPISNNNNIIYFYKYAYLNKLPRAEQEHMKIEKRANIIRCTFHGFTTSDHNLLSESRLFMYIG